MHQKFSVDEIIDKRLSRFVVLFFVITSINRATYVPALEQYQGYIALLLWAIFYLIFFSLFTVITKRATRIFVNAVFILFLCYTFGVVFSVMRDDPVDILLKHDAWWSFMLWLPVGVATYSVSNYKILYETIYKYSYLITFFCSIAFITHILNPFIGNYYDMNFSNILILPLVVHVSWLYSRNRSWLILLFSLWELVMMLVYGSRTAVVGLIIFVALSIVFYWKHIRYKGLVVTALGAVVIGFFVALTAVNDKLEEYGIYSRTLDLLSQDDYDQTGTRELVWEVSAICINDNPIIGYGLGGYYYKFYREMVKKDPSSAYHYDTKENTYQKSGATFSMAHSGFLEFMLFWGVPIGAFVGIWLIFSIFMVRHIKDDNIKQLMLIFYSAYVLPSMTVAAGVYFKPGCAVYIFLMWYCYTHYAKKQIKAMKMKKKVSDEKMLVMR